MSKITTPNEIIGKLDEMINAEESEIRKLEEIVNKTNSNKSNLSKSADIISDNEINLQIIKPRGSRKQVIKPGFTYASFLELVQATLGKDQEMIGFRNESQLGVVYIRSNQDVRLMEKYYFESGQENLQVVAIEKEKKEFFKKFNFKKELTFGKGCAVFRCELGGPDFPMVFTVIKSSFERNEGINYLETIFGKIKSLRYEDSEDDIITVDSDDSWNYCMENGLTLSEEGKFQRLLIETN